MEQINTPALKRGASTSANDEETAKGVEYGLLIAVVSIALALALPAIAGAGNSPFSQFVARVTTCLATATCVLTGQEGRR